ncbi:PREDICTED: lysosomal thioesterase PPT2 isoform X1 [Propithecus coquereli]|uniref:lysosomal thioesterase PPT2 isoform X1 n=1 Tax=Propithecus coquereli TaxID=379532 RepID=UPI00063EFDBB|nr:PREDICTED: lysosomal thioesterase PPT2 isoform X1 [Propithecus coquereli]
MLGLWGQRLPSAWVLLLLPFLPLLLPAAPSPRHTSYKPVIVVHGLFDSSYSFRHLLEYINETHPGTVVTVLDLFDGRESLRPLWEQVQGFREAVVPIMAKAPRGVHLICYSQGGLVCRALLSVMDDHNVDSFISLSSPQMGQYGDTDYLKWLFPTSMRSNLYRICYSPWGQEFSICNYWHDPHHDDLYLNASSFLALINGERDHPNATAWRKNFLRVGRLVLIGGPDDGVITPWQSSFFGFYDANETVLEMEEQLGRSWEVRNQVFNSWLLLLLLLLLLLRIWLYRRTTQPLPTTGVFQATQDIFSFCLPHVPFFSELPCHQPSQPPRGTTHESGVLRLPHGDSTVLKVSVLGNICGL